MTRSPISFFLSVVIKPSSFKLSLHVKYSSVAHLRTLPYATVFKVWDKKYQSGIFTCFEVLMQPRPWVLHCHTFQHCYTKSGLLQHVLLFGISLSQMQDFAFPCVEPHGVFVGLALHFYLLPYLALLSCWCHLQMRWQCSQHLAKTLSVNNRSRGVQVLTTGTPIDSIMKCLFPDTLQKYARFACCPGLNLDGNQVTCSHLLTSPFPPKLPRQDEEKNQKNVKPVVCTPMWPQQC